MPNKKLEKLNHNEYVLEKKWTAAQHEEKRLKNELKHFIGAFTAYGYKKDSENKNRLVIDDEAAHIVEYIFTQRIDGILVVFTEECPRMSENVGKLCKVFCHFVKAPREKMS